MVVPVSVLSMGHIVRRSLDCIEKSLKEQVHNKCKYEHDSQNSRAQSARAVKYVESKSA